MMALTFRRAFACRDRRHAALLLALGTVAGVVIAASVVAVFPDSHAHALDSAGAFKGTPIGGVQNFVEKLKGSLVWLGFTAMGLVIAVVGLMFATGHSRAQDLAIKTLLGLGILASVSGIVA